MIETFHFRILEVFYHRKCVGSRHVYQLQLFVS